MKKITHIIFSVGILLCSNVIFAENLTIDNQTNSNLAFKVLHTSKGGWCTGNTLWMRILIPPYTQDEVSWDQIEHIFLFDKRGRIGFANVHLTNDCTDHPIASVTINLNTGMINATPMDDNYNVKAGSYFLSTSPKLQNRLSEK